MNGEIIDRLVDSFIEHGGKFFIHPFNFVGKFACNLAVTSAFRYVVPKWESQEKRSNYRSICNTIYKSGNDAQKFVDRASVYSRRCGPRDATGDKPDQYP